MICLFAIFTPLGVGLGMLLKNLSSDLIELIFACLAAGSFLYIACSEVIVEEFSISDYRFLKLFFFVIGIAIISSLAYIGDPEPSCFMPEKCDKPLTDMLALASGLINKSWIKEI